MAAVNGNEEFLFLQALKFLFATYLNFTTLVRCGVMYLQPKYSSLLEYDIMSIGILLPTYLPVVVI